jgi:DNA-binding transcriptional ArsR family regulator
LAKRENNTSAVFNALADPTRRQILVRLSKHGETRVTDLAEPFAVSLPSISKHLRVLEKARLIRRQRHGRVHMIQVNIEGMREAQAWITHCAAAWAFSLDTLHELLRDEQKEGKR